VIVRTRFLPRPLVVLGLAGLILAPRPSGAGAAPSDSGVSTLITHAVVIDGSGAPRRKASVRIVGDSIAEIGALRPRPGEELLDAGGKVLAPGFIDTHSHADDGIFDHPDALAAVSQGITTVVVGQDGGSRFPLRRFFARLRRRPAAVNVASFAGHGTIRSRVLGDDFRRVASAEEVERMEGLLRREMEAGALGLSSGLEYDPGIYSSPAEVLALATVASTAGGRYISHIRSEDRDFWKAIDEIIDIGRRARLPVQISHLKLAMRSSWGKTSRLLSTLDRARASGVAITADIYPYTYWQSTLTVLFPKRDFENRETAAFVLKEIAAPDGLLMAQFDPEPSLAGLTLQEIARRRGADPVTTLIDMIRQVEQARRGSDETVESVIGTSMDEKDVERLVAWPHANFCTDGELDGRHPRGFGTYPRLLGRFVRERKLLGLEEAIRKASGLAATHMGIADRGMVKIGMKADLVLLDPATVLDRATPTDPQALSAGIEKVWVNGQVVFSDGKATGARSGSVITRGGTKAAD
jgi:N-acyl-D-amino-acid deacylase